MEKKLPYRIFKISGKKPWYYQFLAQSGDGKKFWTLRKALRRSASYDYQTAVLKVLELYANGGKQQTALDAAKKGEWTNETAAELCRWFKAQGLIADYQTITDNNFIPFVDFIRAIYAPDSERTMDLKRKGLSIGVHRIKSIKSFLKLHYVPFFGSMPLNLVTKQRFKDFSMSLQKKQISNTTKNYVIKIGKTALRYAYQKGFIKDDIANGDYLYINDTKETLILSFDQAKKFFSLSHKLPLKQLYINALACCCGMRPGEIQALKVEDLGESEIFLNHAWDGKKIKSPKNGKTRKIIFSPNLKWILEGLKRLGASSFCGFVFESDLQRSKPISQSTIQKYFNEHLKLFMPPEEAKKYHFYQWRHFHDTYMIGNGLDAQTLQRQSGHTVELIMNLYSNHETREADEKLKLVQEKTFSGLFPEPLEPDK